ncbi:unnamed protein product [Litomosoides sigmodontis]|uniref:Uncharacterized protein n=1 Tax=Litomosoides sigmodontis TaxID=42156 RepID=A0A3P6T319_LITSI|nr:unnamed protein product [Litomosoides sigmodontis]
MNLCKVLWSRLTLGVLSVLFVILYIAQYKKYHSNYAYLSDKCSKLMVHSGGLSAQLQLLMERNHRAEELLIDLRAKYNQALMETNERYENREIQWLVCETQAKEFRKQIEELREEAKNISTIKNECEKLLINLQVRFMKNSV